MQIFSVGRTNQPKVVQEVLADLKKGIPVENVFIDKVNYI